MAILSTHAAKKQHLMELPIDTLVDILLRLPAKSLGRIQCVSRTLLKMVNNVTFSTLHTRLLISTNSAAAYQVPQFICCYGRRIQETDKGSVVTLQSLKYNDDTLTKGRYAITISSPYGVCFVFCNLFFLRSIGDFLLMNPLREGEVVRLPKNSLVDKKKSGVNRNDWFGMGFDDKTNTYKILGITDDSCCENRKEYENNMKAHILVLGRDSWREITSLPPCDLFWADQVCANGDVHWLTMEKPRSKRIIISFDFKREEFYCIPTPPRLQGSIKKDMRLLTLKGSLAIVQSGCSFTETGLPMSIEIWVLEDFEWVRRYKNSSIPDSFPCRSRDIPQEWEHGIFFTSFTETTSFRKISVFLLDLRYGSVRRVIYSLHENETYSSIHTYREGLISLRDYGSLEDAHQVIA